MDAQRALLDELMGPQRDIPESQRREILFDDPEIDKMWLIGMQPFDMFRNTPWSARMPDIYRRAVGRDYPAMEKAQPKEVLEQWEKVPPKARTKYGYEATLFLFLEELVRANDRSVQRARQAHEAKACEITDADAEKLRSVDADIASMTKSAEAAGEEGDVDGSLELMAKVDELQKQREAIIKPQDAKIQKVLVCEVSGNVVQNTDVRIQEHYSGRIYLSWKAVRDKLAELRAHFDNKPPPRPVPGYNWRKDPEFHQGPRSSGGGRARRDDDDDNNPYGGGGGGGHRRRPGRTYPSPPRHRQRSTSREKRTETAPPATDDDAYSRRRRRDYDDDDDRRRRHHHRRRSSHRRRRRDEEDDDDKDNRRSSSRRRFRYDDDEGEDGEDGAYRPPRDGDDYYRR